MGKEILENTTVQRPGGLEITRVALSFCNLKKNSMILDIGCGTGVTVKFLNESGYNAHGIDLNVIENEYSYNISKGSGENIPFEEGSFDVVIMECSFSLMHDSAKVLQEVYRVLKQSGFLIITDMYALNEPAILKGEPGILDTRENILQKISINGLEILHFEDFTRQLREYWGQQIMNGGAQNLCCHIGASPEQLKKIKCGYYLMISKKK